jgi:hypothetical protein
MVGSIGTVLKMRQRSARVRGVAPARPSGLDVALEALGECQRKRRATTDDIWKAAKACRVANVMRPYMEALS